MKPVAVHVWGCAMNLLRFVPAEPLVAQVWSDVLADNLASMLKDLGLRVEKKYYLDMVVDGYSFKPYKPEMARRLRENDVEHLVQLKMLQGRPIDVEDARRMIKSLRYYGVFVEGKLVSITCSYVRLRNV